MVVGGSRSKQRTSKARELLTRAVQQFSSAEAEMLPEPTPFQTQWDDVQSSTLSIGSIFQQEVHCLRSSK